MVKKKSEIAQNRLKKAWIPILFWGITCLLKVHWGQENTNAHWNLWYLLGTIWVFYQPLLRIEPRKWSAVKWKPQLSDFTEATTHFISSSIFAYNYILHIKFAFISGVLLSVMYIWWSKSLKNWENWKRKKKNDASWDFQDVCAMHYG